MPEPLFLDQFPVNPTNPVLNDLQGNILKGHGRQFTFNLFLSFRPDKITAVKTWIANFSSVFVTSARKQLDETRRFHDERIPGSIFVSFFLTADGYQALGVTAKMPTKTGPFVSGLEASGPALNDPAPSTWSRGLNGNDGTIHAMILVADADIHHARSLARAIKLSLIGKANVVATERGVVLRNAKGEGIEHNNYVDGVSQPTFFTDELPPATDKWNPRATPRLMLVKDPGGKFGDNSMGSFFVFRKLEQNVRGFKTREKEVAKAVFNLPANETTWTPAQQEQAELIGAWAVGRFEDGTPVVLHGTEQDPDLGAQENNFNYLDAGSAGKCPFHAHIRKTMPRTDGPGGSGTSANVPFNQSKFLVRRGIPYQNAPRIRDAEGNLSDKPEHLPTGGVGLLFMCYVADIAGQFEFVQKAWANAPNFAPAGTGKDPLIGQPADKTVYHWPPAYGDTTNPRKDVPFGDFITMRGGAYFFAPSISMLKSLKPPFVLGRGISLPAGLKNADIPTINEALKNPQLNLDALHPGIRVILTDLAVARLDQTLQLFVPEEADIGAGVVNVPNGDE